MSDTTALRARLQRLVKHEHRVKNGSPPHCCGAMPDGPHDDLCLWDALREAITALAPPAEPEEGLKNLPSYYMADRAAAAPAPEGLAVSDDLFAVAAYLAREQQPELLAKVIAAGRALRARPALSDEVLREVSANLADCQNENANLHQLLGAAYEQMRAAGIEVANLPAPLSDETLRELAQQALEAAWPEPNDYEEWLLDFARAVLARQQEQG